MTLLKFLKLLVFIISTIALNSNLVVAEMELDAYSGNFGEFGPSTLKFVRTHADQFYRDLTEVLIGINMKRRSGYLVQKVKEGINLNETFPSDDIISKDFNVYEKCALTIAFNVSHWQQWKKIRYGGFDSYRTNKFQNFIVINQNFETRFYTSYCLMTPGRIYSVKVEEYKPLLESITLQWHHLCPYCPDIDEKRKFKIVNKPQKPSILEVYDYINVWDPQAKIAVAISEYDKQSLCLKWLKERKETAYALHCSVEEKYYSHLFAAINITRKTVPTLSEAVFNKFGYVHEFIRFRSYGITQINSIMFIRSTGFDILYCDFDKRSEKTGIDQWLAPFEFPVWVATAAIILITTSFYILAGERSVDIFLIEMARMFLKQPIVNFAKLAIFVLQPLVFFSFVLINHYEYFLTSGLIVPRPFQELRTLNQFVEQNYTFVYLDKTSLGHSPLHEIMEPEFKLRNLNPGLFNQSSIGVENLREMFKQISPKQRKHCIVDIALKLNLRYVQNYLLEGKFKCYIAPNLADINYFYAVFYFVVGEKAERSLSKLVESGITRQWEIWRDYGLELDRKNLPELEPPNSNITFKNLSEFFATYFITQ